MYERRKDLRNVEISAAVSNWIPLCIVKKSSDGRTINATGFLPGLFALLQSVGLDTCIRLK